MEINFEHISTLRVRYGETDQMGYCYYGNYAQYFEVGRVEAMRKVGMSYKSLEEKGVMLPVSEFKVNYKFPAKYDDLLSITTKIVSLKGARIVFHYIIHNESEQLISEAETTLVFVSKETMRPISPPKAFIEALSAFEQ
ncbi:MAG: acyl-CoA thioesterase [Crocinitomicaceae bacterium]|jgi:acyl-CoA thioester hydrolase|nr:acyl-CoA thioesterase [Crocinitomicaceae bacterium]